MDTLHKRSNAMDLNPKHHSDQHQPQQRHTSAPDVTKQQLNEAERMDSEGGANSAARFDASRRRSTGSAAMEQETNRKIDKQSTAATRRHSEQSKLYLQTEELETSNMSEMEVAQVALKAAGQTSDSDSSSSPSDSSPPATQPVPGLSYATVVRDATPAQLVPNVGERILERKAEEALKLERQEQEAEKMKEMEQHNITIPATKLTQPLVTVVLAPEQAKEMNLPTVEFTHPELSSHPSITSTTTTSSSSVTVEQSGEGEQGLMQKASGMKDRALNQAAGVKEAVVEKAEGMKEDVMNKVGEVQTQLQDSVADVKSTLSATLDKLSTSTSSTSSPLQKGRQVVSQALESVKSKLPWFGAGKEEGEEVEEEEVVEEEEEQPQGEEEEEVDEESGESTMGQIKTQASQLTSYASSKLHQLVPNQLLPSSLKSSVNELTEQGQELVNEKMEQGKQMMEQGKDVAMKKMEQGKQMMASKGVQGKPMKEEGKAKLQEAKQQVDSKFQEGKQMASNKMEQGKAVANEQLQQGNKMMKQGKQIMNEKAGQSKQLANEKLEQGKQLAGEKLEQGKKMMNQGKQMVNEKLEQGKRMANDMKQKGSEMMSSSSSSSSTSSPSVSSNWNNLLSSISNRASDLKNSVTDSASQLSSTAGETLNSVSDKMNLPSGEQGKKQLQQFKNQAVSKFGELKDQGMNLVQESGLIDEENNIHLRDSITNSLQKLQGQSQVQSLSKSASPYLSRAQAFAMDYLHSWQDFLSTLQQQDYYLQLQFGLLAAFHVFIPLLFIDYPQARMAIKYFSFVSIFSHAIWYFTHSIKLVQVPNVLLYPLITYLLVLSPILGEGVSSGTSSVFSYLPSWLSWLSFLTIPFQARSYFFTLWLRSLLMIDSAVLTYNFLQFNSFVATHGGTVKKAFWAFLKSDEGKELKKKAKVVKKQVKQMKKSVKPSMLEDISEEVEHVDDEKHHEQEEQHEEKSSAAPIKSSMKQIKKTAEVGAKNMKNKAKEMVNNVDSEKVTEELPHKMKNKANQVKDEVASQVDLSSLFNQPKSVPSSSHSTHEHQAKKQKVEEDEHIQDDEQVKDEPQFERGQFEHHSHPQQHEKQHQQHQMKWVPKKEAASMKKDSHPEWSSGSGMTLSGPAAINAMEQWESEM